MARIDWIRARHLAGTVNNHALRQGERDQETGDWVRICAKCGAEARGNPRGNWSGNALTEKCDPRCSNCGIPLRAIIRVKDGRCVDRGACGARRREILRTGGATLYSPEGVTRITLPQKRG